MEFTVERIEQATDYSMMNGAEQGEAQEYLLQWTQSENSLNAAFEILSSSQNQTAVMYAASVLKRNIPYFWGRLTKEDHEMIRNCILEKIPSTQNPILGLLITSIAEIIVFDWPEEWNAYETLIIPEDENPYSFSILSEFFVVLETSPVLTEDRKQMLRNVLLDQIEIFWPRIEGALYVEELAIPALQAYQSLLQFAAFNTITNSKIIHRLAAEFLPVDSLTIASLKCLETIFLVRTDGNKAFRRYKSILINALSTAQTEGGAPVTSIDEVAAFLIQLFQQYLPTLEFEIANYESNWDDQVQLKEAVHHLCHVILSMTDIKSTFWRFWNDVGTRMFYDQINDRQLKATSLIFEPMLPEIRNSLFERLPLATDENGQLKEIARKCFARFYEYDFQGTIAFITTDQTVSSQLCYAIGCLELVRAPTFDMTGVTSIIYELIHTGKQAIQNGSEDNLKFLMALLYGLSRSPSFLDEMDLFNMFFQLALTCVQCEFINVANAATYAINFLSIERPELFIANEGEYIDNLIDLNEHFIVSLEDVDSRCRMYECVFNLITGKPVEDYEEKLSNLFEPITSALVSDDANLIITSLQIIAHTGKSCKKWFLFAPTVLPSLLQIASISIPDQSTPSDNMKYVLDSLLPCLINDTFEANQQNILTILQWMNERNLIDPTFFEFIGEIRSHFSDIGEQFPDIFTFFIQPALNYRDPPLLEIMQMIARFKGASIDIDWLINVADVCLRDLRAEVNNSATKCLIRVFREMGTVEFREIIANYGHDLIVTIFRSLTDYLHKQSFESLVKCIYKICNFIIVSPNTNFDDEFAELMSQSIMDVIEVEPRENFVSEFIQYLNINLQNPVKFQKAFANFLVGLNKISPGDNKIFQVDMSSKMNSINREIALIMQLQAEQEMRENEENPEDMGQEENT